jgi:hypothetical protein
MSAAYLTFEAVRPYTASTRVRFKAECGPSYCGNSSMLLAVVRGTSVWCAHVLVFETIVANWRCGAIVSTQRKFSSRDVNAPNGDVNRVDVLRMGTMCLRWAIGFWLDTELAISGLDLPSTKLTVMSVLNTVGILSLDVSNFLTGDLQNWALAGTEEDSILHRDTAHD